MGYIAGTFGQLMKEEIQQYDLMNFSQKFITHALSQRVVISCLHICFHTCDFTIVHVIPNFYNEQQTWFLLFPSSSFSFFKSSYSLEEHVAP